MDKPRCANCVWVDKFSPRKDELERGLILGCKKPDFEGYTRDDKPACGGSFFVPAVAPAHAEAKGGEG